MRTKIIITMRNCYIKLRASQDIKSIDEIEHKYTNNITDKRRCRQRDKKSYLNRQRI
jgi:hypothetical protein